LKYALKQAFGIRGHSGQGDVSPFQALMTALAATIGTGNIAGVATAVSLGGPGALFWMWVTAVLGMATKYAEAILAVKYRVVDAEGRMAGGPMYYIEKGLGLKPLAVAFAAFAVMASFGIGSMVQGNTVAISMRDSFHIPIWCTGLALMGLTGMVILRGVRGVMRAAAVLAPLMAVLYIAAGLIVIILNIEALPGALLSIFRSAFSGPGKLAAGAGGAAMRYGIARGIFSNEAGLGSSPIAAAAAKTDHPGRQALIFMTGTFIDTLVICSVTGLVLILTGVHEAPHLRQVTGVLLTGAAFDAGLPGDAGGWIVAVSMILFGYSTVLGWVYYGERSVAYLLGNRAVRGYRFLFLLFLGMGALIKLDIVWARSDVFNGLMAIPNLVGVILLNKIIVQESTDYTKNIYYNESRPLRKLSIHHLDR
jgi:AGCS family alanine or glycine:cation symporter